MDKCSDEGGVEEKDVVDCVPGAWHQLYTSRLHSGPIPKLSVLNGLFLDTNNNNRIL